MYMLEFRDPWPKHNEQILTKVFHKICIGEGVEKSGTHIMTLVHQGVDFARPSWEFWNWKLMAYAL